MARCKFIDLLDVLELWAFERPATFCAPSPSGLALALGITPTYPATAYGYIRPGSPLGEGVFAIDRFVELSDIRRQLAPFYSATGRPSVDPNRWISSGMSPSSR